MDFSSVNESTIIVVMQLKERIVLRGLLGGAFKYRSEARTSEMWGWISRRGCIKQFTVHLARKLHVSELPASTWTHYRRPFLKSMASILYWFPSLYCIHFSLLWKSAGGWCWLSASGWWLWWCKYVTLSTRWVRPDELIIGWATTAPIHTTTHPIQRPSALHLYLLFTGRRSTSNWKRVAGETWLWKRQRPTLCQCVSSKQTCRASGAAPSLRATRGPCYEWNEHRSSQSVGESDGLYPVSAVTYCNHMPVIPIMHWNSPNLLHLLIPLHGSHHLLLLVLMAPPTLMPISTGSPLLIILSFF